MNCCQTVLNVVRHNLTQYVCCEHFAKIFGHGSAYAWVGCIVNKEKRTVEHTQPDSTATPTEAKP